MAPVQGTSGFACVDHGAAVQSAFDHIAGLARLHFKVAQAMIQLEDCSPDQTPSDCGFFASAPLPGRDGARLGRLCIADPVARPDLGEEDRAFLATLAAMTVEAMELRRALDRHVATEATLRNAESQFRGAFQISPHGMAIVALDGKFMQVNPSLSEILGYSEAELLERDFQSISHRDDLLKDLRHLTPLLMGEEQQYSAEKRFVRKDGSAIWASVNVSSALNDQGRARHLVVQITNIQHRRDSEARIEWLVERNRLAVEAGKIGIWEWRVGDPHHIWDEQVFRHFGFPVRSRPKTLDQLMHVIHPDDREPAMKTLTSALESGDGYEFEHRVIWPSGEIRHLQLRAKIIRNDQGAATRVIGTCVDVTELRTLTERLTEETYALRHAKEEAERASDSKSLFCANMSHELRTPLNAVIGLSYLIAKSDLNDQQRKLVKKIGTASSALLTTINSVLEISRNGTSNICLEVNPFNIFDLVENVVNICTSIAGDKTIEISSRIGSDISPFLSGDATRIHQILLNLLGNAVKFTDSGSVRLIVEKLNAPDEPQVLKFTVSDTGIGIASETLDSLFQPFVQADSSVTRRFGGSGLGLSIARVLVELMGGEIGVNSELGKGSDFWCKLPIANCSREDLILPLQQGGDAHLQRLANTRILLVDDSDINLEVGENILQMEGSEVETATNGQAAVDMVLAEPDRFDVILLDLQMPILNGYDAFRQIRLALGERRPAVIALTAGAFSATDDIVSEMEGCMTKPFEVDVLITAISRCIASRKGRHDAMLVASRTTSAGDAWPDVAGFDARGAAPRMGNNLQLYRGLLDRFFSEFTPAVVEGKDVDAEDYLRRIHRLKGSSGLLGLTDVHRLATQLEKLLKDGETAQASQLTAELKAEVLRMKAVLSGLFVDHDVADAA